ncbi:hypothetical protein GCM10009738_33330 [Kitasatospora viridis]
MSMWFTPSSTARRSTRIACPRSLGTPPNGTLPVRRIAPRPIRWTVRSPSRTTGAGPDFMWELEKGMKKASPPDKDPDREGSRSPILSLSSFHHLSQQS